MAMIGALLTAVASTAFLLGSTSGHRPANHQVTTSSKFADLHRPLHLPRLAKGKACPIGKAQPAARLGHGFSRHLPAVGRGPVYPLTVGGAPAGTLSVGPGAGFWRGQKTPWIAARSYRGPVLIRGGRIDGSGAMRFAFTTGQRLPELRLPHDRATGTQPNGWRAWPSLTLVRALGCYAYQIDGATFSRIIVIRATA